MRFKDYIKYNTSDVFKSYENFIVNEMSLRMDSSQDILNKNNNFIHQGEYYKNFGKYEEDVELNNNTYSIYRIGNSQAFLDKQNYAAAVIEYVIDGDKITMKYINALRSHRDIMFNIFINYLLNRYNVIISDDVQTSEGFEFYKKMCYLQKIYNYEFFILNGDKKKKITDPKEMDSTFGYDPKMLGYRYSIEKYD